VALQNEDFLRGKFLRIKGESLLKNDYLKKGEPPGLATSAHVMRDSTTALLPEWCSVARPILTKACLGRH
jgi:hypothetical protein